MWQCSGVPTVMDCKMLNIQSIKPYAFLTKSPGEGQRWHEGPNAPFETITALLHNVIIHAEAVAVYTADQMEQYAREQVKKALTGF